MHTTVKFNTLIHKTKTKGVVDYIYSDLWGVFLIFSKGYTRYLLTFIYNLFVESLNLFS